MWCFDGRLRATRCGALVSVSVIAAVEVSRGQRPLLGLQRLEVALALRQLALDRDRRRTTLRRAAAYSTRSRAIAALRAGAPASSRRRPCEVTSWVEQLRGSSRRRAWTAAPARRAARSGGTLQDQRRAGVRAGRAVVADRPRRPPGRRSPRPRSACAATSAALDLRPPSVAVRILTPVLVAASDGRGPPLGGGSARDRPRRAALRAPEAAGARALPLPRRRPRAAARQPARRRRRRCRPSRRPRASAPVTSSRAPHTRVRRRRARSARLRALPLGRPLRGAGESFRGVPPRTAGGDRLRHRRVEHRRHDVGRVELLVADAARRAPRPRRQQHRACVTSRARASSRPRKTPGNASTLLIWFG